MKKLLFKLPKFYGFHVVASWFIRIFTLGAVYAITLFPFVIYRNKYGRSNLSTRTHESIHILQQMECGMTGILLYMIIGILSGFWLWTLPVLFFFYIMYLFFFLINLIRYKDSDIAYNKIPFEEEAYQNQNISVYLGLRKPFAWIKYICKEKIL